MTDTNTAIDLDRYAGKEEAVVARRLVRKALKLGYTVSVNDGEEWTVKKSSDRMTILCALASTGEDFLKFRNADGEAIGTMMLVYQNGPGDELIADYSANDAMDRLFALANGEA
jgi:hypothetical protein